MLKDKNREYKSENTIQKIKIANMKVGRYKSEYIFGKCNKKLKCKSINTNRNVSKLFSVLKYRYKSEHTNHQKYNSETNSKIQDRKIRIGRYNSEVPSRSLQMGKYSSESKNRKIQFEPIQF